MPLQALLKKTCGPLNDYVNEVVELEDAFIIRFKGDVDKHTIPCIRFNIEHADREFIQKNIIADFTDVDHVDSATLAAICDMLVRLKTNDKSLALIHVTDQFYSYLKLFNLEDKINVFDSEKDAVASFNHTQDGETA